MNTPTSFPIGFDLYDEDEEQILFITDDVVGQELNLDITNTSDQPISLRSLTGTASKENYHFELVFRPGTLYNNPSEVKIEGSNYELFTDKDSNGNIIPNDDGTISLYIKSKNALTLPKGNKVAIKLSQLRGEPTGGSRGTRVLLNYQNLLSAGSDQEITGFRDIHLYIINRRGKRNIPMEVGFIGSNTVLNDGVHQNVLKLRVTNSSRKQQYIGRDDDSRLVLVAEGGEPNQEWTLATDNQLANMHVLVQYPTGRETLSKAKAYIPPADGSVPPPQTGSTTTEITKTEGFNEWIIPFVTLGPGEYIDITINTLITNHFTGHSNMFLHYENIPGYWDGQYVSTVEKQPLIYENKEVGIGTATPVAKLQVIDKNVNPNQGTLILGPTSQSNLRMGYDQNYSWIQSHGSKPLAVNPIGNNVGIGTDDPGGKLTVIPNSEGRGVEIISSTSGNTHFPWSNSWNYISGKGVIFRDEKNIEQVRMNMASGNVGLGTTSPAGKLHVFNKNETANGGALILGPTNQSNLRMGYNSNYSWIQSHGSKPLAVNPIGNNVGVGTLAPAAKLDVNGNINTKAVNVNSNIQFNKIQAGHVKCGSHGGGVKEVTINFPQRFRLKPMCVCTVRGEGYYNDTFAVTVKYITTASFKVNIARMDSHMRGWGQNVRLDWFAFEIDGYTGF